MSKEKSLWDYTSKARKPWFHTKRADDKATAVLMWVMGLVSLLAIPYAVIVGQWKYFWLAVILQVLMAILDASQDEDAPWMATPDDPFICPHCHEGFTRKDMTRGRAAR